MNINVIKNTFKPTNTFNLFRQISPLDQETKHCDRCNHDILLKNYNKHLQSRKHKNNEEREGPLNSPLKTIMGHLKDI